MHELSIAMSIVEIAEENAKNANTTVIIEIELDIGSQSGGTPAICETRLPGRCGN